MSPLRLVFVTRRFWPLVGGAAKVMANLAVELTRRGYQVTILTAKWKPNWPARITFHEVPVVRLPHPPENAGKTLRYMRSLARWLKQNEGRCDLVYVSALQHDAYAVLRAVGGRVPVVLRAEKAGRFGDCLWQLDARCGRRIKQQCMKGAGFVGPTPTIERELKAAGYPRPRIHYLPDGVPIPPPRSAKTKATARAVLAAANAALDVPESAPLAVYTGRLHPSKGLNYLVAAWGPIIARWPNARLWLAGEGPDRAALHEQIEAQNLTGRVILVGVFDTVDELLAAADLFVLPSLEPGGSQSLLGAMGAGLPIVATDIPGNRAVISNGRHGLLVPVSDSGALSAAIGRLIEQPDLAAQLGATARERATAEFSLAEMANRHVTLFEHIIHRNSSRPGALPATQDDP